jgi:hypothetical protein
MVLLLASSGAFAQPASTQPAAGAPATTRPAVDETYRARVLQVMGRAECQTTDDRGEVGEWRPVKQGDELPAGARVRTRLRSKLVIAFGADSVVVVEQLTLASVDDFYRSGDTKVVRVGLGHGAVRAGVQETTLRSDMTIETPTAVLSKRGTMDFGISYEPGTGRFRVYLAREGLVEILDKLSSEARLVRPGQYVTQAMMRWIETVAFDRWIPVVDTYGLTDAEQLFNRLQDSGLTVVDPGGGHAVMTLRGRDVTPLTAEFNAARPQLGIPPVQVVSPGEGVIVRPEGNFGTGPGSP